MSEPATTESKRASSYDTITRNPLTEAAIQGLRHPASKIGSDYRTLEADEVEALKKFSQDIKSNNCSVKIASLEFMFNAEASQVFVIAKDGTIERPAWYGTVHVLNPDCIFRVPIDTPHFKLYKNKIEKFHDVPLRYPEITDDVVRILKNSEIGTKYRLLLPHEVLTAELGSLGRYSPHGHLELLEFADPFFEMACSWRKLRSVQGAPNTHTIYRAPIDTVFIDTDGAPMGDIPENMLRYSFFCDEPS